MSINADYPIDDYSSIAISPPTSPDSFLGPSPLTIIEITKHPISLKEAKTLRQDSIKMYALFEKALTEHSSLTAAWQLASNIKERPTLQKAYDLEIIHKRKQLNEALTDPKIKTSADQSTVFLALNTDEVNKRSGSQLKAELFCLREDVLPRQVTTDKLCDFIHYPYSQHPEKLPFKTRAIALDILRKNLSDPFKEKRELEFLGQGFHGNVHKITVEGEPYAVKTLQKENQAVFDQEYENLLFLDHPNIVKLLHADDVNLYMEYIEGTPFADGDFNLRQTLNILIQIADALIYLHDFGYIHGDLHGHNILVAKEAKLIDFDAMHESNSISSDIEDFGMTIETFCDEHPNLDPKHLLKKISDKCRIHSQYLKMINIKQDLINALRSVK